MASDPSLSLHRILIMKEAVLDFAKRREIPPPSWWTDVSTDAGVTTKGTHSIAASPIPAPTHSAGPRGRRPKKLDQVKEAMREDIRRVRRPRVASGICSIYGNPLRDLDAVTRSSNTQLVGVEGPVNIVSLKNF